MEVVRCRSVLQVLRHQKGLGVKGITTVLGPPVHTFPPLFRQTGIYSTDYCINRQARPAYRCNMDAEVTSSSHPLTPDLTSLETILL